MSTPSPPHGLSAQPRAEGPPRARHGGDRPRLSATNHTRLLRVTRPLHLPCFLGQQAVRHEHNHMICSAGDSDRCLTVLDYRSPGNPSPGSALPFRAPAGPAFGDRTSGTAYPGSPEPKSVPRRFGGLVVGAATEGIVLDFGDGGHHRPFRYPRLNEVTWSRACSAQFKSSVGLEETATPPTAATAPPWD